MARADTGCVMTVDVGNTATRFGLFKMDADGEPLLLGTCELSTLQRATADEARIQTAQARTLLPPCEVDGTILSCVVPALTDIWRRALRSCGGARPLVVGPGLRTGVRMRYDDPSEVGPDRIADVVAARARWGAPAVVVDLGTTTNFEVVDAEGAFAGGIIAPGIALGARSLSEAAARLPAIELRAPERVVGRSTRAAMQSGVVLGEAARIDGLLDAVAREVGISYDPDGDAAATVVMTGEDAPAIAALLSHRVEVDETLTLRGLALLWRANRRS